MTSSAMIRRALALMVAVAVRAIAPEPWPTLHGGSFSGPARPLSPDPLVRYVWGGGVNVTALQLFNMTPVSVSLVPGTSAASFVGYESLTSPNPHVSVRGSGALLVDFGVELPAWIELDSPDLAPSDLRNLQLATGEYAAVDIVGTTLKQRQPIAYGTTYRLETNAALYEGVRFAIVLVTTTPGTAWTITSLRAVTQAKPVNYTGTFDAHGDSDLTRIYYTAAYTVRTNLEPNYIGAILEDRGDRISWAGDAHVAQATFLAVFGNSWDVLQNLVVTGKSQNGIASYSLYFVDSVMDYFLWSHDNSVIAQYRAQIESIVDDAYSKFNTTRTLTFYGWDDRVGSGFQNASCDESQWSYRFLAVRELRRWGDILMTLGNTSGADYYHGAAARSLQWAKAALTARAGGGHWWDSLGIHAAADAANTQALLDNERVALISAFFNDTVSLCSLSNFNQYFFLQALASLGAVDRGVASIHLCWGAELAMGATTFWEISHPDWVAFTPPHDVVPNGENGYTSLCHPWSAGPAAWLAAEVVGVKYVLPRANISRSVLIAPHVTQRMATTPSEAGVVLSGAVPFAGGGTTHVIVRVGSVSVDLPANLAGVLVLSHQLIRRLNGADALEPEMAQRSLNCKVSVGGAPAVDAVIMWRAVTDIDESELRLAGYVAPLDEDAPSLRASNIATLRLQPGTSTTVYFGAQTAMPAPAADSIAYRPSTTEVYRGYPPFPPPTYRATFIGADRATSGSWIGTYGKDGGVLFGVDGGGSRDLDFLPPYVTAVRPAFSFIRGVWDTGVGVADVRAPQDPRNATGPRTAGYIADSLGGDPSFVVDVTATPGRAFRVAVYALDWDSRNRRSTFALLDGRTLDPVAPIEQVVDYVAGVWFVWEFDGPFRLRVSQTRGDNAVVVAMLFDSNTTRR